MFTRSRSAVDELIDLPSDPCDLRPKKNHARRPQSRRCATVCRSFEGRTREDVASYYRLHALTRRRLGVPVQPRRFFDLILRPDHQERTGVRGGDRPDSTTRWSLRASTWRTTAAWWPKFGASDPDRQDTGAGYLIDWETMCAACVEGYRTLDLGRTDADAEGLRLYKSGWGAVEEPLVYTHWLTSAGHTRSSSRRWAVPRDHQPLTAVGRPRTR